MLNIIKDNDGARKKYKRLGRGIGSGKGKTSARGGKGQTARSGVSINGFEGGQMPLYMRLPRRGFNNHTRVEYVPINFSDVARLAEAKKIDLANVTLQSLVEAGLLKNLRQSVKLLGTGEIKSKFKIEAHAVSKKAQEMLTKAGCEVVIVGAKGKVATEKKVKTVEVKAPKQAKDAPKKSAAAAKASKPAKAPVKSKKTPKDKE